MLAEHVALHDVDVLLAFALVALILGVVEIVRSRMGSVVAWAVSAVSLALVISWWPE